MTQVGAGQYRSVAVLEQTSPLPAVNNKPCCSASSLTMFDFNVLPCSQVGRHASTSQHDVQAPSFLQLHSEFTEIKGDHPRLLCIASTERSSRMCDQWKLHHGSLADLRLIGS